MPFIPASEANATVSLNAQPRLHYTDRIRVYAMMGVVAGHVADMPMFQLDPHSLEWWVCNAVNSLVRWAVPLYVMVSGALLLDPAKHEQSIRSFYLRRFTRVGIPLLLWSIFYLPFSVYYTGWSTWSSDPANPWRTNASINLLRGIPYVHLHFIFAIAGLYLFTPMLRVFVAHAPRRMVAATVILLLGLSSANSLASVALDSPLNAFSRFAPFLGYFLAGFLLKNYRLGKQGKFLCLLGFLASALLLALWTGHFSQLEGKTTPYPSWSMAMYDFLSPIRIGMALCVWLLFASAFTQPVPESTWRGRFWKNEMVPAVLGIALCHPMIREIFHVTVARRYQLGDLPEMWPNVWIGLPLWSAVIWAASLLLVMLLRRLPILKRTVG